MKEFTYTITDEIGIHARPAGLLVKLAKAASSPVTIARGEKQADLSKLMAVMGMGVRQGDAVTVRSEDEAALEKIRTFFEENL